ncbi:hypothetical protein SERLADRAFT_436268 [Serpula lacrymans var. lacrymans S7.9]|uniref:T-box domain-containing protein n=1 Tax=Serpula lacrymans var. lacrymans (strain S7.9) TaxID=578457 RepID=F8NSK1_SERL9|nr:uncharacterized protein SERLADRAFT_436268 [Serpula lacrymans var. lacrymans S7.9]EGO26456.1 hypothetical protein SERLADRAFT_436268 [Serpula lacrymans var. lacrymans S7.9]
MQLRRFATAARQLGGSVGILSSAFRLRERLAQIKFLFQENAADLFPGKVPRQPRETLVNNLRDQRSARRKSVIFNIGEPVVDDDLDSELFPEQFGDFADDVMTFLRCLNEFPEFADETVSASIHSFERDLKHWADSLQSFKAYAGQLKYPASQKYIHELTAEMGHHIDNMIGSLSMFIEIGIPSVLFTQKHDATTLTNLSTVATFFSAVTATTLQFSIAAAINSLLGLTWKQALYHSPGYQCPRWIQIWIKRSPLVFLMFSVACFSVGLVLFTYSTNQHYVTSTITVILTAFTSLGLLFVVAWIGFEKWIFVRFMGQKWLRGVISDVVTDTFRFGTVVFPKAVRSLSQRRLQAVGRWLKWMTSSFISVIKSHTKTKANIRGEDPVLPVTRLPSELLATQGANERSTVPVTDTNPRQSDSRDSESAIHGLPRPKERFRTAVNKVMVANALRKPYPSSVYHRRHSTGDAPRLKNLVALRDLSIHDAPVHDIQFSPDGKLLATCSLDRTSVLFSVDDIYTGAMSTPCILPHTSVSQVAWSPTGHLLLTRTNRGIKIWTGEGLCKLTIDRQCAVHCVSWFPGGEAFVSAEGDQVVKLDLDGNVMGRFKFPRMMVRCIAITPNSQYLLGIGHILISPNRAANSSNPVEKWLLIYNLETRQIEDRVLVHSDVRDIAIDRSGSWVLVSYEYKAPPQLWKIDVLPSRRNGAETTVKLSFRHKYIPFAPVDFAGPSCFGGIDDQFVLCAGKAGDIYIWDRESAMILHNVRAPAWDDGDLTCIAYNNAEENKFTFATGSHFGPVRIWTTLSGGSRIEHSPWLPSRSPTSVSMPLRAESPEILNDDADRSILQTIFTPDLLLVASPTSFEDPGGTILESTSQKDRIT